MRRRGYLAAVATSAGLVGGCLTSGDGAGTPTATETATPTSTPSRTDATAGTGESTGTDSETATETETRTETPAPVPIAIDRANLLWSTAGNDPVRNNRIGSTGVGDAVMIGIRLAVDEAAVELFEPEFEARIFEAAGEQIDTVSHVFDRQDATAATPWFTLGLDTTGYETGAFEGEVGMTDRAGDRAVEPARFAFDLVEPLSPDEVDLRATAPDVAQVGEPVTMELTFRNLADRTSHLGGPFLYGRESTDREREFGEYTWTLPANSTVTHTHSGLQFKEPANYVFWLEGSEGIRWTIDVES